MKKLAIVILLLAAFMIPGVSASTNVVSASSPSVDVVAWEGDGSWSDNTWYVNLYPGEQASIELKIESSEDAVVYADCDVYTDLLIRFYPPVLKVAKGVGKWIEVTVYASGAAEPGEYEIGLYLGAVKIGTEIVYRDRYVPGPERVVYVDKIVYVDRDIPKYVYVEKGIGWWWIPLSVTAAILGTLLFCKYIEKRRIR